MERARGEGGGVFGWILAGLISIGRAIFGGGGNSSTTQAPTIDPSQVGVLNPNSSGNVASPSGTVIRDGGFNINVPYGVFQSTMLQNSTSSGIAYATTGPNDWIANGSNLGGGESDGYGNTFWERASNLDFWKDQGREFFNGSDDPNLVKAEIPELLTYFIPIGAGAKAVQKGFTLKSTITSVRSGFLNLGKTFSQYKAAYWAGKTKSTLSPIISPKTGQVWKQYTELHHRFIPQRWKSAPNWLKNNRFNLKPVSSLRHAQMDPYRARFAPKWVKDKYNLIWK